LLPVEKTRNTIGVKERGRCVMKHELQGDIGHRDNEVESADPDTFLNVVA